MQLNRVVITGRGAISPFGLGVETLYDGIWSGRSAVRHMEKWHAIGGLKSHLAAPAPPLDIKKLLPRPLRRTMGTAAIFATLAAGEAVKDAGISQSEISSGFLGTAIGSTTGSPAAYEDFYETFLPNKEMSGIKSGEFFKMMGHSCSANVCLALGIAGEQWAPASACTSSAQAVGLGYMLIQTGRQQMMLCGGADEVHHSVTGVFDVIKAASYKNDRPEQTPSPFDRDRDGVVCGEGCGILLLESYDSAIRRGAKIYAEIIGFGNVNDSKHIASPHEDAMIRAMRSALREAKVSSADIDYVNAHATGTEQGDVAEASAIFDVVGSLTPVSSLKGHIGHTLGAAGSLELISVVEMMARQEVIPTRNLINPDPKCQQIDLLLRKKKHKIDFALKNNFALGGVNTALVLRRI
ncbi:beta-ketoacyl-[acyl-carrier-protein] synthase family protein [Desulfopila inferna]|uniref:beta-ketoacyl-[acyl-carrier-protein] synthase family protein n=1 Tax=Desulfopila inferna TaxID=468528 RepID=UPI0019645653|nr:beta-ketoacyl-[acyl-carrier-protein] synthase family protein [Desulfopila inferna]MBM9604264.1 beta-ketoacyl-[acyl-carrier-protein] synthase family protein [Desulfopila inferna]